jgi:hypothetical protein
MGFPTELSLAESALAPLEEHRIHKLNKYELGIERAGFQVRW